MKTLKELLNVTASNEKSRELQAYFKKHIDNVSDMQTTDIFLILKNDYKIANNLFKTITDYTQKRLKQNKLDEILLVKLTKNLIDGILNLNWFFNYYSYNKNNVNTITRYAIASAINSEILNEINL